MKEKLFLYFGEIAHKVGFYLKERHLDAVEKKININLKNPEEIEAHFSAVDLEVEPKLGSEIWAILVAGNAINFACLSILERWVGRKVKIFYIVPDLTFDDIETKTNHKIVYNILQEYARSGKFESISLFSLSEIEKMFDGLSFSDYESKIYDIIAYVMSLEEQIGEYEPYISTKKEEDEVARIKTYGIMDLKTFEEKYLFNLIYPKEIIYKFLVDKEKIEAKQFRNDVYKFLKSKGTAESKTMFEIFEIENQNIALIVQKSQVIQQ